MATFAPSQQDLQSFFNGETHIYKNGEDVQNYMQPSLSMTPFSVEILNKIVEYAYYLDNPDKKHVNRTANLKNLMMVNSVFFSLCLPYTYKYDSFVRSNMFYSFLLTLMKKPALGKLVEVLDFQEFTAVGLGRSGRTLSQIQNLTERTILKCLELTPNLREFLSSESIEGDISPQIVHFLFNNLPKLESIDFCGSSGLNFVHSFDNLSVDNMNYQIKRLSFHDCTDFNAESLRAILPKLPNLERLDLTHTPVVASDLATGINRDCRLSHISLSKCSNIGATHSFINLLINHPSINHKGLVWLNLQNDYSVALLKSQAITYLLEHLKCTNLRYLNLNGYSEINESHLEIITRRFPHLESLSISHLQKDSDFRILSRLENLKFVDLASNLDTRPTVVEFLRDCPKSIDAIEIRDTLSDQLPDILIVRDQMWRVHNSNGQSRRVWIHKVDSRSDAHLYDLFYDSRIFFNIETGEQTDGEFKKPLFLKYASHKVNCCSQLTGEEDERVFPNSFCERGLYRYYALHR